jgi:hypothetical protein
VRGPDCPSRGRSAGARAQARARELRRAREAGGRRRTRRRPQPGSLRHRAPVCARGRDPRFRSTIPP